MESRNATQQPHDDTTQQPHEAFQKVDPTAVRSTILDCLRFRYGNAPPESYTYLCTIDEVTTEWRQYGHSTTIAQFLQEVETIADELARFTTSHPHVSIYSRMTPLRFIPQLGDRGQKQDSAGGGFVWAEIDSYKTSFSHADVILALSNHPQLPPPSRIESSGGGIYAFWKLTNFSRDWEHVEDVNRWIKSQLVALGADNAIDAARVLRLCGTWNAKPTRMVWTQCYQDNASVTYSLDDFSRIPLSTPSTRHSNVADIMPETPPSNFADNLQHRAPKLLQRILSARGALDAGAALNAEKTGPARYRNDHYICMELLRLGYSPGHCIYVLTRTDWFSGSKFAESRDMNYVLTTVSYAQSMSRPLDSGLFDDKGRLVYSRLGDQILNDYTYMSYAGNLYVYNDELGFYEHEGQHHLQRVIISRLWERWNMHAESEVTAYIVPHVYEATVGTLDHVCIWNGVLDLSDKDHPMLMRHSPSYRLLQSIPAEYVPGATSEELDSFVASILHPDDIRTWWQLAGYCLWPRYEYKAIGLLVGPPDSGKSQLLDLLKYFLSPENCSAVDINELTDNQFAVSLLAGRFANICGDTSAEIELVRSSMLKKLSSGDTVKAEQKGRQGFEFTNIAKLFFAVNQFPVVRRPDEGFFRRFVVLPCEASFQAGVNAIPGIGRKLGSDPKVRSAMLNRGLEGLADLRTLGDFYRSETQKTALSNFKADADSIYDFWRDATEDNADAVIPLDALYDAYMRWCNATNRQTFKSIHFSRRTEELTRTGEFSLKRCYPLVDTPDGRKQVNSLKGRALKTMYRGIQVLEGGRVRIN
jgi:P4 family phage/plasmid primase-like protien